jgi:hypothetical protein
VQRLERRVRVEARVQRGRGGAQAVGRVARRRRRARWKTTGEDD